jgi:predicted transcriptional regulator
MTEEHWAAPVRDFMSRRLVSVPLDAPLVDVQRTLDQNDISAVPVVDEEGALRGILSSKDLLRAARLEMGTSEDGVRAISPSRRARDLMRAAVLTIDERATVGSAGAEMIHHRVHRLIVVREGRPCAVISTRDAMRAIVLARTQTPLGDVMTREVQTIDLGMPVDEAIVRLDDANVRGLIVVDGTWPVGVFTQTEALRAVGLPPSMRKVPVEQVMSDELVCLKVASPLCRVASQARELRARRILAVDARRVQGIAAGFDILRVMAA